MTAHGQSAPSHDPATPGPLGRNTFDPSPASTHIAFGAGSAAEVIWKGSQAAQRAAMRALRDALGDDPDALCRAYVEAERAGVPRTPGAEAMTPLLHARMLWREGKLTGWLSR